MTDYLAFNYLTRCINYLKLFLMQVIKITREKIGDRDCYIITYLFVLVSFLKRIYSIMLVKCIYILSKNEITITELNTCEEDLMKFDALFEVLYDAESMRSSMCTCCFTSFNPFWSSMGDICFPF